MGYELRPHTADVAVEARAETRPAVFAAVADGLAAAAADHWPDAGNRFTVAVEAETPTALLFEYLDELIYHRDAHAVLPVDNAVDQLERTDGDWALEASARGVPADTLDAREIKAVTYSEMRLAETAEGGWEAYVVFDV